MRILATGAALAAAALAFAATAMATGGSAPAPKPSSVAAASSPFGTRLPCIVTGKLTGRAGVAAGRLGMIRRSDGSRQATYCGTPLRYYVGDRKPRQILCQNVSEFGGLRLVVRPNGTVIR
jgi:hypothetical protein